jgi:hypothetical protein
MRRHAPWAHSRGMAAIDELVELPAYRPAPVYEPRAKRDLRVKKRAATLLDRLVAEAGVDHVVIDIAALERDLDTLRAK